MRTTQIRQQLHDYIDSAKNKKLKAIYTLVEDEISNEFIFTTEQKKELDRRHEDFVNGVGKTYTWEETVAMAEERFLERRNQK